MAGSNITKFFKDALHARGDKCMVRDKNRDFKKEAKIPEVERTALCRAVKEEHGFLAKDIFK